MKYLPMISKCAIVVGIGLMVYNGILIETESFRGGWGFWDQVMTTAFGAMLVVAGLFGKK